MEKEILGKPGLLRHRERPSAELSFERIEVEKAHYPVALMCRVLGVATSSFYDWHCASEQALGPLGGRRRAHPEDQGHPHHESCSPAWRRRAREST